MRINIIKTYFSKIVFIVISPVCVLPVFSQDRIEPTFPRAVPFLEYSYAAMRAHQISNLRYSLSFLLDDKSTEFTASERIELVMNPSNTSPVRIDFEGGEILSLAVNGKTPNWKAEKWYLLIDANDFHKGKNQVSIEFKHPYSTTGDGLHRYKDPQSGRVYLYSNFEPFNAHKMFPHFDQPNLKAVFTLSVIAPQGWSVISNTLEKRTKKIDGKIQWDFPETKPMASYVFALHAGPYAVWRDQFGVIPLRLFARQEIAQYVDYRDWFKITKEAFQFYNHYFEYPYPYKKYDQLIVPDFNNGAMENIAAVTFSEDYAPPSKKSWMERLDTADTISHELAHMWFGDLVTMDWWSGLWLNESFATYMSAVQQSVNSEFKEQSWPQFYLHMKQWGYQEDQKVTTHAIDLSVENTEEAFTNFDGITYGKGAAVLRQLAHYIGEEDFRRGVAQYLKAHAYKNATLKDFMFEIEHASGKNLGAWIDNWLHQAGLNQVIANYSCTNDASTPTTIQFSLVQTASDPKHPQLRAHQLELGFYGFKDGKVVLQTKIPVALAGELTAVDSAIGKECPSLVYPNLNDWAYIKVSLDKKSKDFLYQHINEFDVSLKMMLWQSLWDDVLDANFSLLSYLNFAYENMAKESNERQRIFILEKLVLVNAYFSRMHQEGQNHYSEMKLIENIFAEQLRRATPQGDSQKTIFNLYVSVAFSTKHLHWLRQLLLGSENLDGLVLDQDLRWGILLKLNHYAFQDYETLTKIESEKDQSDYGQQMALACEAQRPDIKVKEKWVREILNPQSTLKFSTQRWILRVLFPSDQILLRKSFEGQVIDSLPKLALRSSDAFIKMYTTSSLMQGRCSTNSLQALTRARDSYSDLTPTLKKNLALIVQEEERCGAMLKLMN